MDLDILIIEDELIIALQIKQIIKNTQCNCIGIASSYKEALDISKINKIDLIISDIKIEGEKNGIQTVKKLQELYDINAIFLTSYHDNDTLKEVSSVNFIGYVLKPFKEDEIISLINIQKFKSNTSLKIIINQDYIFYKEQNKLYYKNEQIQLSKKELKLLLLLLNNKNKLVNHKNIEQDIWGDRYIDDRAKRQLIYRFKSKLINFPLELKRGYGYILKTTAI